MLQANDRLTRRQLLSICFIMLLAPIIRPMPGIVICEAGRTSWISVLLGIIPLSLLAVFMSAMLKNRGPGEGLADIIIRALGPFPGKCILVLYSLWFLFFTAHLFRSGSERFVAAVYPEGRPWVFLVLMVVLVAFVSSGKKKTLGRLSELIRPLLAFTFVVVIILATPNVDFPTLLPISRVDVVPTAKGILPTANVFSVFVYASFLEGFIPVEDSPGRSRDFSKMLLYVLLIISALTAEVIGTYGCELSTKMNNPFFQLVENISIMGTLERIEAVVVGIWVLSDFMLGTTLLMAAVDTMCRVFCVGNRLYLTLPCAGLIVASGILMARDTFSLEFILGSVVPAVNVIFVYGILPVVFITGKARKKI